VWLDMGRDNYAGVTWANAPGGRVVLLGSKSNWSYAQQVPTSRRRSAMAVPRELSLQLTPRGYRIVPRPVQELEVLRRDAQQIPSQTLGGPRELPAPSASTARTMEVELAIVVPSGSVARTGLELRNEHGERLRVGYDAGSGTFFSDRTAAGKHDISPDFAPHGSTARSTAASDTVRMQILVAVASMEQFADGGLLAMTETFFPTSPFDRAARFSDGGDVKLLGATLWALAR
jgi:sucrose-6-phosphate hydrolase SacC (GH32 family)